MLGGGVQAVCTRSQPRCGSLQQVHAIPGHKQPIAMSSDLRDMTITPVHASETFNAVLWPVTLGRTDLDASVWLADDMPTEWWLSMHHAQCPG